MSMTATARELRDSRIKNHPAAARHPAQVSRLLGRDWDLDKCMRSLDQADAAPPTFAPATTANTTTPQPVAKSPDPQAEAQNLADAILRNYRGQAASAQAPSATSAESEANALAATILSNYRNYQAQAKVPA